MTVDAATHLNFIKIDFSEFNDFVKVREKV
jgi:hypothetical protein